MCYSMEDYSVARRARPILFFEARIFIKILRVDR